MHITYFSEPAIYFENFVKNSLHGSISQSFYWGKLQETVAARGKFWAFAVEEKNEIIGTCVLIKHKIGKKSCYLYAHRGPVLEHKFDDVTNKVFDLIIAECDKIALVEKALFLRIDPAWHFEDFDERSHAQAIESFQRFFHKKDFIPAHAQYQPLSTLQLDLTKSLDELRKEIRTMGKRNLKKAEESGLDIIFTTDSSGNELRELDRLNLVTSKRDNFYTHNIDYYQKILRIFGPSDMARLYGVKFNNKYLAMALVTFFGKEAVYYYGASDNENRELMAPWLLQWEMIKEAKNRGCTRYDFLGIAPEPYKKVGNSFGIWLGAKEVIFQNEKTALDYCEHKHPFSSITFFKTRWGGTRKNYVGAWEKVYNHRKYRVLLWTKLIRKYIRKLGIKI